MRCCTSKYLITANSKSNVLSDVSLKFTGTAITSGSDKDFSACVLNQANFTILQTTSYILFNRVKKITSNLYKHIFRDEAARMWEKRASEWERERQARQRLMAEVITSSLFFLLQWLKIISYLAIAFKRCLF